MNNTTSQNGKRKTRIKAAFRFSQAFTDLLAKLAKKNNKTKTRTIEDALFALDQSMKRVR